MLAPPVPRLRPILEEVLAVEREIGRHIARCQPVANGSQRGAELMSEVANLSANHCLTILERLGNADRARELGEAESPVSTATAASGLAEEHPRTAALRDTLVLTQQAVAAYAALESLAHRVRDSWVMADEGTTSHIARGHLQEYIAIGGRLVTAIHDTALEELDEAGVACGCTCPCCSIGVCLCSAAPQSVYWQATLAARPGLAADGVAVPLARAGSAAAAAGLHPGDVVVAVDGERIEALTQLQRLVRDHEPGDLMQFTVRRNGSEIFVAVEHRRQGVDQNEDECVVPAGQQFYLDQAQETQRRIRARLVDADRQPGTPADLSPRQLQVLKLLALGASNPMIAEDLELSTETVKEHVRAVYNRLGVGTRAEATQIATRSGLLEEV